MKSLDFKFLKNIGGKKISARGLIQFNDRLPIAVFMGASGVGKSTLAKWIVGLTSADEGYLEMGGEIWYDRDVSLSPQRRRVGFMAQGDLLFPHLSVAGNVGFGLRRLAKAERLGKVARMLAVTGTTELASRMPKTLSGGEKRRVALGQVLAVQPKLLILDEPFAGLDLEAKRKLWAETRSWVTEFAVPTILITHDRSEAEAFTEQIYTYDHDRLNVF